MAIFKKIESPPKPILFSAIAPENQRTRIRSITGQGQDCFRTDAFADPVHKDMVSWHEAWKDQETGSWSVARHTLFNGTVDRKTIFPTACFFDALYLCASHELSEKILGRVSCPLPEILTALPHVSEAAAIAGQPFDQTGALAPATNGRPLSDGQFSLDQLAIAAKTKGISLERKIVPTNGYSAVEILNSHVNKPQEPTPDAGAELAIPKLPEERRNMRYRFERAKRQVDTFEEFMTTSRSRLFKTMVSRAMPAIIGMGVLSAGVIPLLMLIEKAGDNDPNSNSAGASHKRCINTHYAAILNAAEPLPESREKNLMIEFAAAARANYYTEWMACAHEEYRAGKIKEKSFRKALKSLDDALADKIILEEDHARIKTACEAGTMPPLKNFAEDFYTKRTKPLQRALQAKIASLS